MNYRKPREMLCERILTRNLRLDGECWEWIGGVSRSGYGQYRIHGENLYVHRMAYELLVEPLQPDELLHHVCENKLCFNPDHLQPTTREEHQRLHASTTCITCGSDNWLIRPNGWRRCRVCHARREREKAAA